MLFISKQKKKVHQNFKVFIIRLSFQKFIQIRLEKLSKPFLAFRVVVFEKQKHIVSIAFFEIKKKLKIWIDFYYHQDSIENIRIGDI